VLLTSTWRLLSLPQSLFDYDKDNIRPEVVEKVKPHLTDPNFEPSVVERSSRAAMGLCKWVRAMMLYYDVSKVVAPKRAALKAAEGAAQETTQQLQVNHGRAVGRVDLLSSIFGSFHLCPGSHNP
jgi:hypothetical protein